MSFQLHLIDVKPALQAYVIANNCQQIVKQWKKPMLKPVMLSVYNWLLYLSYTEFCSVLIILCRFC